MSSRNNCFLTYRSICWGVFPNLLVVLRPPLPLRVFSEYFAAPCATLTSNAGCLPSLPLVSIAMNIVPPAAPSVHTPFVVTFRDIRFREIITSHSGWPCSAVAGKCDNKVTLHYVYRNTYLKSIVHVTWTSWTVHSQYCQKRGWEFCRTSSWEVIKLILYQIFFTYTYIQVLYTWNPCVFCDINWQHDIKNALLFGWHSTQMVRRFSQSLCFSYRNIWVTHFFFC